MELEARGERVRTAHEAVHAAATVRVQRMRAHRLLRGLLDDHDA